MLERIQKIISAAGVTSRRAAEELITEGRVRLNGQVVTELGTKADANKDHIKVDGKLINPRQPLTYIMLNKPAGFVTTMSDPEGRPTVQDLLKGVKIRVYPVGRLDYNTEGLLLLTNDGDFAHLITHPKHEFPKTYRAKVKGVLEDNQIKTLEDGIYLDDGKTAPAKIRKVSKEEANSWLEITIHEGRKRQVRRMFDRVGHSVIKLKRIRTGNLVLGDLPEGAMRYLLPEEVEALKDLAKKDQAQVVRNRAPEVKSPATASSAPARSVAPRTSTRSEAVRPRFGDKGPRSEERRTSAPGRSDRPASRRQELKPRVMGQGASGRGPRRPVRDAGSKQGQSFAPFSSGARERSATSESRPRSTGTYRPSTSSRNRDEATGSSYKPRGPRTAAPFSSGARQRAETSESRPRSTGTYRPSPGTRNQDPATGSSYKPRGPRTAAPFSSGTRQRTATSESRPRGTGIYRSSPGTRNQDAAPVSSYKPRGPRTAAPYSSGPRQRSGANEYTPRSTGPRRSYPGVREQDVSRPSFKPKGPRTTAARMSGKVFDKSSEFRPKTGKPAGAKSFDRKPQRPRTSSDQGSRGPRRSSR